MKLERADMDAQATDRYENSRVITSE